MIKVLVFVLMACAFHMAVVTLIFRTQSVSDRAALIVRIYVTILPVLYFAYTLTPAELRYLPSWPDLAMPNDFRWVFALYSVAIFGGLLQLYNLTERGFSLRILIDILSSPTEALDTDQVILRYSDGKGVDWMFQKRVGGLQEHAMILVEGEQAYLTPRGRFFGTAYMYLRRVLGLPLSAKASS
ncbi:MAG: hypothetical protein WAO95_01135 [Burkholderiales bacterium]